jgi:AraC family transcriptional activator of pobA
VGDTTQLYIFGNLKHTQKNIAEYLLSPLAKGGIHIVNMQNEIREEHDISEPHRDNHFLLMFATSGHFTLNIDFKEVSFSEPTLFCVFPEQVHHIIEVKRPKGWIISFDPSLIDEEIKQLFESKFSAPKAVAPQSDFYLQSFTFFNLLENLQSKSANKYIYKSIHSLLTAFLNSVANNIIVTSPIEKINETRGRIIKDTFYQLLKQNYKNWKQPSQYASALAISVAHLNDTVKALTGNSVSTHIQQTSILEAKRQLYFTNKSVKEIAYDLGYDEPVYFGKLFKKLTNHTPLAFRQQFRD